jgi:hypothetical protein
MFPKGMSISAHNPAYGHKQRVNTPHLAIIELVLDQLPHVGTAGQLLHLALMQNYTSAPSRLHHELVFFDVNDTNALESHVAAMTKIAKKLKDV